MGMNQAKYEHLVHYVCHRCDDHRNLGATKLNKILYFSDFLFYLTAGKSITGETYIKRQYGPVPKNILKIIQSLVQTGKIVTRETEYHGKPKREYISLLEPDIESFSPQEVSLVDEIVDKISKEFSAKKISELTHDDIWQMASIGEEIPYATILTEHIAEIDEEDMAWAKSELPALVA
jgi:hypothetical protein